MELKLLRERARRGLESNGYRGPQHSLKRIGGERESRQASGHKGSRDFLSMRQKPAFFLIPRSLG